MQLHKANKAALIAIAVLLCVTLASCSAKQEAQPAQAEATPTAEPAQAAEETPAPTAAAEQPAVTEAAAPTPALEGSADSKAAPAAAGTSQPAGTPAVTPAAAAAQEVQQPGFKGVLDSPVAEQPAYLTSVGQSADVQMVKTLLTRAKIEFEFDAVAAPEAIKGKTLILAVGGSSKGLGAAGIKAEDELVRTEKLIEKAEALGMKIICVHVGGEARRGELSDKFINTAIPSADYIILVADGNKDGLFTKLADSKGIPMDVVNKITEVLGPLTYSFKQ